MNSKATVATIFAAIFIFAMCSTQPAYAAPPTDACSLLTPAQVSAALGVPVSAQESWSKGVHVVSDLAPSQARRCGESISSSSTSRATPRPRPWPRPQTHQLP